tara:strand:- start:5936 stop:7306 length:1371 start_codon:yes stop_codon:yes gene_type:complete
MKKLMLICAPVTSRSGYGEHSRDLVTSLIEHDKYDIHIMDVRWGECPRNALDKDNSIHNKISECILANPSLDRQPDIYVDIRIPNEFQTHGKFNIGITAGIETTAVSQAWIEGCNKMDLIIVPSEHSKAGFVNTLYDKVQNAPDGQQQKVGELKLEKPIEVLFEGANEDIYKPLETKEIDSEFFDWLNDEVPEKFAFLSVGQWGKGGYGEDRKDISRLVKVFYESFANKKKQPALILKTSGATTSIIDREDCLLKIKQIKSQFPTDWRLPNVYLLHGDLSAKEMNYLYNHPKVKSLVSLTHGEGFGRPMLEATMVGLPVIASAWSGQMDFLDNKKSLLLPGDLVQVPKSAIWENIIIAESKWFVGDEGSFYKSLNIIYREHMQFKRKAEDLMSENREKFTLNKMTEKFDEIIERHIKNVPQQVGLQLPKLNKVGGNKSKSQSIKLPKLKKITGDKV